MKHPNLIAIAALLSHSDDKNNERASALIPTVRNLMVTDGKITADVASATSSTTKVYKVTIHLDAKRRRCECEAHHRFKNRTCKHVVAVGMVVKNILSLMA